MSEAASASAPTIVVIFGATGDLAHRKLYPALGALAAQGRLANGSTIIGVSRTRLSDEDFGAEVRQALEKQLPDHAGALDQHNVGFRYVAGSYDVPETFSRLAEVIATIDTVTPSNRLFYLATIPQAFAHVADGLAAVDLNRAPADRYSRLIVEKPFGENAETAARLDTHLHHAFDESQVFRIDHYLAKETVQNVLALRLANTIFEPIWNRRYVGDVQITVAEDLGVGHRGTFYESAGVTRDVVQNHALQLLALTAMETPPSFEAEAIRDEKVKLLRSVRAVDPADVAGRVVRAQYAPGVVDGAAVRGYREEVGVDSESRTETFVAMRLDVDNWRWAGVPFYLRSGKRLARRATEVVLRFRQVPFLPLPSSAVQTLEPNMLTLRIQPDEGVALSFAAKVPGSPFRVRSVDLDFDYRDGFGGDPPEAYVRVLGDAIAGDATLFIRTDEVAAAWRIVDPILEAFATDSFPLHEYPAGTWGPEASDVLIRDCGDTWQTH